MAGHANRPLSVLSTSFLLCYVGTAIYLSTLRAAEVYFTGSAWHGFGTGAFLGAAVGIGQGSTTRRYLHSLVLAVLSFGIFLLLPTFYSWIARCGPEPGAGLLCAVALPAFVFFYCLARFATVHRLAGDRRGVLPVLGALLGAAGGRLFHDFFLVGNISSTTVVVAGLIAIGIWTVTRGSHMCTGAGSDRDAATDGPGVFPAGAFFLGAALTALYPVSRKVLHQISPTFTGTDLAIFCIVAGGALLGALFVLVVIPGGRWRLLAAVIGTAAFGASLHLLDRQFDFTQDMVRFRDFKDYFHLLHERYAPFLREEFLLYLAFVSIPSFTAGVALCAVRGAWSALLFGMGVGFLAGAGGLPWTGSASALVIQAILAAACGATLFVRAGLCLERAHFPVLMKTLSVLALGGMWIAVVWSAATFAHSDYKLFPIQGEKDLLLFEPSSENDLRVTVTLDETAVARLDTNYAYFNRGIEWVARLVSRMPAIVGLEGECLLAGPLAPLLTPLLEGAVADGSGAGSGGERRFSAFETVPALRGASAEIAAHEGMSSAADLGEGRPLSFYLLDDPPAYSNILLLPRFPNVDADRGRLSHEIFELVHDALAGDGTAWVFLDTTDLGTESVAGVAAAFGDVFPASSLWLLEDGLLPPYLVLIGRKGGDVLPGDLMASRIEETVARQGLARADFRSYKDLSEYLIADADGMQWFARNRGMSSARCAVRPVEMDGRIPGWEAVDHLTKIIPSASLETTCGRASGVRDWAMQSRRFVLGGLYLHGMYTYTIDRETDIDWELFDSEVGLYAEAFRAYPDTALGRKVAAALMPMLIDTDELQVVFETIGRIAGVEPEDVMLRYYLALVSFKLLDYEDALRHLEAVVAKDPLFVDGVIYAGLTCFALDRKAEAATFLERAHQLDEDRAVVYKPLAISLFDTGRKEEAGPFCLKALEQAPDDEDLKSLRMLIENRIILEEEKGKEEEGHEGHDHDHLKKSVP